MLIIFSVGCDVAEENEPDAVAQEETIYIERIKRRLDLLDQRLDNIDSMVTAVAERIMSRPITLNISCPHCSKNIEIDLTGNEKPTK